MLPQDVDGELVVLRLRIQALKPGQDDADGVAVVEICVLAHDGGITFVRVVGVGDSAGRGEEAAQHRRERPTNRPLLPHGVPRQCNRNHGQRGGELLSKTICSRQTAHRCLSSAFHPRLHKAAYVLCATVAIPFRGRNPWFAAAFRPGQGPRLSLVPGSWYAWPLPGWTLTYWSVAEKVMLSMGPELPSFWLSGRLGSWRAMLRMYAIGHAAAYTQGRTNTT
jgi:hypothetical protein